MSLDDEKWGVGMKGEEVADTEEKLNLRPKAFQTKAETEVSFVSLWQAFCSCVMVAV